MKLNIANQATGQQKTFEFDDEHKFKHFFEKRVSHEVPLDPLGEEWTGYVVRITGGEDKQGFSMKQGVLVHGRVRLLLKEGVSCYRPGRKGERKRKSVRGCIVDHNMGVLSTVIIKKGAADIRTHRRFRRHQQASRTQEGQQNPQALQPRKRR